MKDEILYHIAESFFRLTAIPTRIYHQKQLLKTFGSFTEFIDITGCDAKLLASQEAIDILLNPLYLAFGYIACKDSCDSVIFGPIRTLPITDDVINSFLTENNLPLSDSDELHTQLDKLLLMYLDYFADILASVYCSINHEIVQAATILNRLPLQSGQKSQNIDAHLLADQEAVVYGDNGLRNTYNYEQKMLHYVKNGMVEELNSMGELDKDMHIGSLLNDSLRYYKNLLLAQNTLISRAAIEGGLAPDAAYSMSDYFVMQIENCETVLQLSQVSRTLCNDYCNRVRKNRSPHTDNIIANKAIQYIIEHIHEHLSAQEIADHLGISREYLSSKFKKATGNSIPDFINKAKIDIAKRLLRFTDKPLVMISNYLSYSSQSYFQTQFKRIVGMTPMEYRQSMLK